MKKKGTKIRKEKWKNKNNKRFIKENLD